MTDAVTTEIVPDASTVDRAALITWLLEECIPSADARAVDPGNADGERRYWQGMATGYRDVIEYLETEEHAS